MKHLLAIKPVHLLLLFGEPHRRLGPENLVVPPEKLVAAVVDFFDKKEVPGSWLVPKVCKVVEYVGSYNKVGCGDLAALGSVFPYGRI